MVGGMVPMGHPHSYSMNEIYNEDGYTRLMSPNIHISLFTAKSLRTASFFGAVPSSNTKNYSSRASVFWAADETTLRGSSSPAQRNISRVA